MNRVCAEQAYASKSTVPLQVIHRRSCQQSDACRAAATQNKLDLLILLEAVRARAARKWPKCRLKLNLHMPPPSVARCLGRLRRC